MNTLLKLYCVIRYLCPDIIDTEFSLVNIDDTPQINTWTSQTYKQPTDQQIQSVTDEQIAPLRANLTLIGLVANLQSNILFIGLFLNYKANNPDATPVSYIRYLQTQQDEINQTYPIPTLSSLSQ